MKRRLNVYFYNKLHRVSHIKKRLRPLSRITKEDGKDNLPGWDIDDPRRGGGKRNWMI